jgi:hypothetical protein
MYAVKSSGNQPLNGWNGLRGHLTELGVIAPQGPKHARELADRIEACDETIPIEVCEALGAHAGSCAASSSTWLIPRPFGQV